MFRLKLIIRRAMLKKLALVIIKAGTLVSRKVALKVANSIYLLKVFIKNIEVELKLNKNETPNFLSNNSSVEKINYEPYEQDESENYHPNFII